MVPDVAVIGGGIVGTSAAAFLAEAGAHVVLYERAAMAAGASGRNSGVVQRPLDPVLGALYRETLDLYRALGDLASGGFALPATPAGLLFVGRDEAAVRARLDAVRAAVPDLGTAFLEGAELRSLEPALAPGIMAARLDVGYPLPPAATTRAFAALARSRGARLEPGASAVPLFDGDRASGVRVDGVAIPAGLVIVAAGPWSPSLVDPSGTWRPITSRWGVVVSMGLERPPGHVLEQAEIATEPADGDPTDGVEFSLVTAAGTSSVGSTFLPSEPEPSAWASRIIRAGSAFVPEIGRAPVLGYRACARPQSLDGRPLAGAVPGRRGLFVVAGHGPWGISTGPASARRVADLVLGGAPRTEGAAVDIACDPGRFPLA